MNNESHKTVREANFGKTLMNKVVLAVFLLLLFLSWASLCDGHGHSHDHEESPSYKYSAGANTLKDSKYSSKNEIWLYAFGGTLLVSLAPYLVLFLIPLDNTAEKQPFLKILLSFASGGLLGDAFLHLIPSALQQEPQDSSESHSHSHSNSHGHSHSSNSNSDSVGVWVLTGILTFLIIEKFVRIVQGGHGHSHDGESKTAAEKSKTSGKANKDDDSKGKLSKKDKSDKNKETNVSREEMKVAGYLNLAADFSHNLTDGLAIGASFLAGKGIGIVTTVTIVLHELPHEIGDYAILIQSGCSRTKAMTLQLVTALGAFTGTFISLMLEGIDNNAITWVLPFTAGGFIYIATVTVIPELLSQSKFWQSLKEVCALLFGVYMMILIAKFE